MAKAKYKPGILIDNQTIFQNAFRAGKKAVVVNGIAFTMRKVTNEVIVKTKANPYGTKVLEHWLVVSPADGSSFPRANLEYPYRGANSRSDLL